MAEEEELRRDRELLGRAGSKQYEDMVHTFHDVREGFRKQSVRADDIMDYWAIYNCELNSNQTYNGNSELYVPIVYSAIDAIKTRLLGRLFPSSGRYFQVSTSDNGNINALVALLENYVRQTHLRTQIVSALIRNGEVEGQFNLYVDWNNASRWVVSRETVSPQLSIPGLPQPIEGPETIESIVVEEVFDQHPLVEVFHDTDILVQPFNANSIDDALQRGGEVTIVRRWSKAQLEDLIERKEVRRRQAEELLEIYGQWNTDDPRLVDKELIDGAGIRGPGKFFQVYETWKVLDCDDGRRLCKIFYGGYDLILSCRRNPFWNDRCPLLSAPKHKVAGSFKGISPVSRAASLQYHANDIANEAADSATYSMLPIIMTDPAKNPRTSTMLLNLAAIWEVDPNSTRFAEFPKLWQDGIQLIQADQQTIFQLMGVSPGMLPQQSGRQGGRRNQAEVAMEQNVDIMTTDEAASTLEDEILSPMVQRWVDYDHQFRDTEMTVRMYGAAGEAATMQQVPVLQNTNRIVVSWYGVEQARNAALNQQRIALLNVAMAPPMQQALQKHGKSLDPAPALEAAFGELFGWREGRKVLVDQSALLAFDPEQENEMLAMGFAVPTHPMDQDPQHIPVHQQLLQHPDPAVQKNARDHINLHMLQQQTKSMMQMQQQMQQQQGQPPQQRPQQAGPGRGGGPTPPMTGGAAAGPRLMRGPAGTIPADQMPRAGAVVPPRGRPMPVG